MSVAMEFPVPRTEGRPVTGRRSIGTNLTTLQESNNEGTDQKEKVVLPEKTTLSSAEKSHISKLESLKRKNRTRIIERQASEDDDNEEHGLIDFVVRRIEVPKHVWDTYLALQPRTASVSAHASAHSMTAFMRASADNLQQSAIIVPHSAPRRTIFFLPSISPYHWVALLWQAFMLIFDLTYTAFWVPLSVGFCTKDYGQSTDQSCTKADLFGGCIYAFNLLMAFQWGCVITYDNQKREVRDGILAAGYYMRYGRFVIDTLATIPFLYLVILLGLDTVDSSSKTNWLVILSLLRLIRLLRLVSISKIVYMDATSGKFREGGSKLSVTKIYIFMLTYTLLVIINFMACIMILIANLEGTEESWLISLTWIDAANAPAPSQWYCAVYWIITTCTTTGYGDITPKSQAEQVAANFYMIMGMVMFGLLVGTISNTLTRASQEATKLYRFRKKINMVTHWLKENEVPEATCKQIQVYFSEVWANREEMSLDAEIFGDLPHYLRQKVAAHINLKLVKRMTLFRNQEEALQRLVAEHLRPVDIGPGSDVCQQGEEGDRLWMLQSGRAMALQHLAEPVHLRPPCMIGDSILVGDDIPSFRIRSFTIRTVGVVKVWELRLSDVWPILRMYPDLRTHYMDYARNQVLLDLASEDDDHFLMPEGPGATGAALVDTGEGSDSEESEEDEEQHVKDGKHKRSYAWCDPAVSIARSLMKQPPPILEQAVEELRKARTDDGSLQQLLDGLLEFSTVHSRKPPPLGYTMSRAIGSQSLYPTFSTAPSGPLGAVSVSNVNARRLNTMSTTSGGGSGGMPSPCLGAQRAMSIPSPEYPTFGGGESGMPLQHTHSGPEGLPASLAATLDVGGVPLHQQVRNDSQSGASGMNGGVRPMDSWPAGNTLTSVRGQSQDGISVVQGTGSGGGAQAPASGGTALGIVTVNCPTCGRHVCNSCGQVVTHRGSAPAAQDAVAPSAMSTTTAVSGFSQPASSNTSSSSILTALGLSGSAGKGHWRPSRLGRQTLFRVSSLVDRTGSNRGLGAGSVPIQEFGVGYTNFG